MSDSNKKSNLNFKRRKSPFKKLVKKRIVKKRRGYIPPKLSPQSNLTKVLKKTNEMLIAKRIQKLKMFKGLLETKLNDQNISNDIEFEVLQSVYEKRKADEKVSKKHASLTKVDLKLLNNIIKIFKQIQTKTKQIEFSRNLNIKEFSTTMFENLKECSSIDEVLKLNLNNFENEIEKIVIQQLIEANAIQKILSELLNLNENEKNNDDDNDNEEKPKEEKKKNQIKKQKSNPKNIKKQIEKDDEQKKNNNDNESDNDSDNSDDNSDDDDDDESEEVVKDSFFLKPIIRKSETTKLSPSDTKKTKTKQIKKNKNSVKYANLPVETRERRIAPNGYTSRRIKFSSMFIASLAGDKRDVVRKVVETEAEPTDNANDSEIEEDVEKFLVDPRHIKKKRLGQRQRRQKFESIYGKDANHLKKTGKKRSLENNDDTSEVESKKAKTESSSTQTLNRKQRRALARAKGVLIERKPSNDEINDTPKVNNQQQQQKRKKSPSKAAKPSPSSQTKQIEHLHPSWQAKKAQKLAKPAGKHIKF